MDAPRRRHRRPLGSAGATRCDPGGGPSRTARVLVVLGLLITLFFAVLALFADRIAPYEEDQYRKEVGVEADGTPIFETLPKRARPSARLPVRHHGRPASTCSRG